MKAIVAILFVCLATGANAGCLGKLNPFSKRHEQGYDLVGLEEWLEERAPMEKGTDEYIGIHKYNAVDFMNRVLTNSTRVELDHGFLRANVGQIKDRKMQNTAQLVLLVADLKECNQQVLVVLNEVARAKIVYGGSKRTERIIWKPMQALYKSCGDYIDEKLRPLSEKALDDHQKQFVQLLGETELWLVTRKFVPIIPGQSHSGDIRPTIWHEFFRLLSEKDEKALVSERLVDERTKGVETVHHRDRFNHVIKDYLLPSCKSLTATVADKFDFVTLQGLGGIYCKSGLQEHLSWAHFMTHRSAPVQTLTSAYNFCSALLSVDYDYDTNFEVVKQYEYDLILRS